MHSEWIDGLVLRPLMDAGYTAWRGGTRVGVVRFAGGRIEVEADDLRARTALVERLSADLRAAGIVDGGERSPDLARDADARSAA